jgi:hypothetical protein
MPGKASLRPAGHADQSFDRVARKNSTYKNAVFVAHKKHFCHFWYPSTPRQLVLCLALVPVQDMHCVNH